MQGMLPISVALAAAAPLQSLIQNPAGSQLVAAVQSCQQIKDDAARLSCYDRSVSALATANARGDVTIVDRDQIREVRRSLFGFSLPKLPFFSGSKEREVAEEPKELVSKLASFHDIGNGFFRFTISDPQSTWESTEASSVLEPTIGDKATITRGALGSYFAQIGDQGAVRVRRIR